MGNRKVEGSEEGKEEKKKRTATCSCRTMKAVLVPDLCAIFTLVPTLHARRYVEISPSRDSDPARSRGDPKGTGLLDRYVVTRKRNNSGH